MNRAPADGTRQIAWRDPSARMDTQIFQSSSAWHRLAAVGVVLAFGLVIWSVARWMGRRLKGSTRLGLHELERLAAPVTLLAVAAAAAVIIVPIAPPALEPFLESLAIVGGFWLAVRVIDVASGTASRSSRLRASPGARQVVIAGRQLGKVLVATTGAVAIAVQFGAAKHLYLLLGGVGAALAFAARDPIRNAVAFASMLLDPPYHPGDRVRLVDFRGGEAAVGEVIGVSLSATSIRSDRNTLIVVPNTVLSQLRVENLSAADRHRLELAVAVPDALTTQQLREACEAIERDLTRSRYVNEARPPRVWLAGAGAELQVKASAWLRRAADRREAQYDLLLAIRARLEPPHTPSERPHLRRFQWA